MQGKEFFPEICYIYRINNSGRDRKLSITTNQCQKICQCLRCGLSIFYTCHPLNIMGGNEKALILNRIKIFLHKFDMFFFFAFERWGD